MRDKDGHDPDAGVCRCRKCDNELRILKLEEENERFEEALKHIRQTTCIRAYPTNSYENSCCAGPGCPGWVAARVLKGENWKEKHDDAKE
jgi:hypothetical protein